MTERFEEAKQVSPQEGIEAYLEEKRLLIEQALKTCLQPHNPRAEIVYQAMEYSLLAGGKRLRPILFLVVLESLGEALKPYLPFACALEMIHTYSLIHDDLPTMDDDDLRRGKPTCHKVYGEDFAILAGDGLLTHSFAKILSIAAAVPGDRLVKAAQEVALSAGLEGMLVGQVVDIAGESKPQAQVSLEDLNYIHRFKTGALFRCSVVSAGILAGAEPSILAALKTYADNFGLAFQIIDDILDIVGDEKKLGKQVGSDAKNKKITYPLLMGLEEAKAEANRAIEKAFFALKPLGEKGEKLQEIAAYLLNREF